MVLDVAGLGAQGIHDVPGRGQIGIAHPQVDDISAFILQFLFLGVELGEQIGRQLLQPVGGDDLHYLPFNSSIFRLAKSICIIPPSLLSRYFSRAAMASALSGRDMSPLPAILEPSR